MMWAIALAATLATVCVFLLSWQAGRNAVILKFPCEQPPANVVVESGGPPFCDPTETDNWRPKECPTKVIERLPQASPLLTRGFVQYKNMRLLNIRFPQWTLLLHQGETRQCQRIAHVQTSLKRKFSCLAVVPAGVQNSLNLLRHEEVAPSDDSEQTNSTGFFGNVANFNGRRLLQRKMGRLLEHFSDLESYLRKQLESRGLRQGSSIVLMVLNAGEMDIFANFMCSCRLYNVSSHNFVVFSSSLELMPILERMNVLAIHHPASFAEAAHHAAFEYLDPIFIDMMWYKSFSLWLLLQMGYNVLFQDVDIVWFRNPFHAFTLTGEKYQQLYPGQNGGPDGFFSDDGQRSLRYAPFYANSGFFFLKSNPRSVNFAWGIMTAFTIVHISGSHQNVFTLRLLESLDLSGLRTVMLPMRQFPSGVKFSHDRPFMRGIKDGHERPYIFHMCWTKNREHKLVNFHESAMWYVNDRASAVLGALGNLTKTEVVDYHDVLDNIVTDHSWRRRSSSSILDSVCKL